MRLIDADTFNNFDYSSFDGALTEDAVQGMETVLTVIDNTPTINAVPVNELLKLRDRLYESDGITMGGLRSLNELIAKYSSNPLPRMENGFESKISYDRLLQIAKKMHTYIFLNSFDEQEVYDEIGLTDEENTILGYMGRLEMGSECV